MELEAKISSEGAGILGKVARMLLEAWQTSWIRTRVAGHRAAGFPGAGPEDSVEVLFIQRIIRDRRLLVTWNHVSFLSVVLPA